MNQFLQEHGSELFLLIFMAIWWMGMGLFSIKGDVKSLDKKRAAKGLAPMTNEEKQLVKETFRSSILSNFGMVVVAGVVAIVVMVLI